MEILSVSVQFLVYVLEAVWLQDIWKYTSIALKSKFYWEVEMAYERMRGWRIYSSASPHNHTKENQGDFSVKGNRWGSIMTKL